MSNVYRLPERKATDRRVALEDEFWEPATKGWRAASLRQTYTPSAEVDWSGVWIAVCIVSALAAVVLAHTLDFWGL